MYSLVTIKGPNTGRRFLLAGDSVLIGRQEDAAIYLDSLAVSRQHARVLCHGGEYFIEDVGSSNGTFVNGKRISTPTALTERDALQIGPYVLNLRADPPATPSSLPLPDQIIRAQVAAAPSNHTLYNQNPAHKLQVVLEIAQHLGHTLEMETLLGRLLEHLLRLFPQADRGMVLLCEGELLKVRAQHSRHSGEGQGDYPYSRTIVRRALEEGVGLLSEDVSDDPKLVLSATMISLNLRSFLCVPLLGWEDRRLGVIQLDCLRPGHAFDGDDLELLTAVAIQVATVLENAALHAERLREERLRQELLLARDIQQAFLPADFGLFADGDPELFARVHPAREVSGDLYDFFRLPDDRLAFFLGDVSGKGMPAALFMIAVRTLIRHLAPSASSPSELLCRLNRALADDNPTALYVTLLHGIYDRRDGSVVLSAGGHPPPLLRRRDGRVEEVPLSPGLMLGTVAEPRVSDTPLSLEPGETLILYSDGFTEAFTPDRKEMFGRERLCEVLGGARTSLSLESCADETSDAVQRFSGQAELQDDQTLLLLRRRFS
ncbi:MAG TPA: SpoIIE family protein phosphatase [Gemmataceae bacterium]|nr:SpoIIE family protein phosphatase [Gemmataceae bacterium]